MQQTQCLTRKLAKKPDKLGRLNRNQPRNQLKKLVNDAGMLPDLLLRMLDAGDVSITRLENGAITECSHITLV